MVELWHDGFMLYNDDVLVCDLNLKWCVSLSEGASEFVFFM